jgi:hypothetical protein
MLPRRLQPKLENLENIDRANSWHKIAFDISEKWEKQKSPPSLALCLLQEITLEVEKSSPGPPFMTMSM